MNENTYYVYIEANKRNRVFYVGITNNLARRNHKARRAILLDRHITQNLLVFKAVPVILKQTKETVFFT